MRTKYSRIVAIAMAALAGGLAAFALRPAAGTSTSTLAARNPAVEVRTQVIRRTVHITRHEHGAALRGARGASALVIAEHGKARTKASGGHGPAHAAGTAAVATRVSGAHGTSNGQSAASAAPVATRSSGSHSASAAPATQSHPVTTRSSGSHSGSTAGSSASGHPVTRSSGGGHRHGEDGGGGDD